MKSDRKLSKMYRAYHLFCFCLLLLLSCQPNKEGTTEDVAVVPELTSVSDGIVSETPENSISVVFDSSRYSWKDGHLELSWSELSRVDFNRVYDDSVGAEIDYPIFSDSLKVLDGRRIRVSGYIIPMEETGDETIVILSAFPFSQCFFCGLAGPESVIDIIPKKKLKRQKMDAQVTFRGKLKLNESDLRYLYYILEEAELE